jgi:cation-transporting ATPase 13A1
MSKVGGEAGLVLAGCHSLVYIDEETTGDPLESAALKAMRWTLSPSSATVIPAPATEKKEGGKALQLKSSGTVGEVQILTRHHFSSKLQRMSCVIRSTSGTSFAVAKGSPEAIGNMLSSRPAGYDDKARHLAKEGYRVIALAYKLLGSAEDIEASKDTRAACESNLSFAGFIAFTCRVRKDTASVLQRLKEGGMSIAMVTGDAILTAIHVSKEVGICEPVSNGEGEEDDIIAEETNEELRALLESKRAEPKTKKPLKLNKQFKPILLLEEEEDGSMFWQSYEDDSKIRDFVAKEIPELARTYDLATTGKSLAAAFQHDDGTKSVLGCIKVFARMTPDAKETVIECLHSVGALCLMCGDGANDVGALKQADVGVALLSGFGDLNVDRGEDGRKKKEEREENKPTAIMSQEHLNSVRALPVRLIKAKIRSIGADPDKYPELVEKEDLVRLYQIKAREVAVQRHDKQNSMDKAKMSRTELQAKARADAQEKQRKLMARVAELEAQGEQWATFKAMREFYNQEMEENKKKKKQFGTIEGSAAAMAAQFEDMETGELPMVKIGDASVAAPFTSKMPSIRSCVDIVRQGRCTLVSSIQMYQILALNCLISSYSLSVLYLDGVKYGDTQMTAMGMLGSISFMSVSRSKPLDKLSKVRPLTSIFHPALFISLLGQFAIHLSTMILATQSAKSHLPPDYEPDLDGVFKPGILNTVVFLVSNVQQVCVFVVNLQGRPFMTGLTENRPLLWSLLGTFILTFMFASESVPGLNKYFQLVPFPDHAFRDYIITLLAIDVCASFMLDRILKFIFCPKILIASVEGTTLKDVMGLARTVGIMFFLMYTFLGNDEQWEELMLQEGRHEELGLNATNATNSTNSTVLETVIEAAKTAADCVGEACRAAATTVGSDEF